MKKEFNPIFDDSEDWDFRDSDINYFTHGLHPYPAKMIPPIAERLLKRYASPGDLVLDPFCGSGGVLVESRLAGMNSIGIDLNPLACLLSEIKSNPINPDILEKKASEILSTLNKKIMDFNFGTLNVDPPNFFEENILYWFKLKTIKELTIIRDILKEIKKDEIRRFFDVPFSRTVREVSGTRKNEFKLYRMKEEQWNAYDPDTFKIFKEYVRDSIKRMKRFYNEANKDVYSKVYLANSQDVFTDKFSHEGNKIMENKPPSIIVTSPPYGDHKTTVAYGQFSRYSSLWLDYEEDFKKEIIWNVDNEGLGGTDKEVPSMDYDYLQKTVEAIQNKDEKRAKEALVFFFDLYKCLDKMYELLKDGGYACIVVANRTMKRIVIPTHYIIAEMGVDLGFNKNVTFYPRKIPSKRLPWRNAPENIPGLNGMTMSRENIIVFKK